MPKQDGAADGLGRRLAYAQLYDQRAGAIEVEIRESKQGVGINRRRKKRAAAQAVLTLLGTLAHNVLVWARAWLGRAEPRLKQYGLVRLLRDVLCVSGFVETDERGAEVGVVLNRGSTLARLLAGGLRALLRRAVGDDLTRRPRGLKQHLEP